MHIIAFANSTQFAGLVSYGAALAACAIALSRPRDRMWWIVIAAVCGVLTMDVWLGLRHELARAMGHLMGYVGWYGVRREVQAVIIGVGAAVWIVMMWRLWRLWRTNGRRGETRIAGLLAALGLGLSVLEAVSLHQVNAWTSRMIGPIMLIAWAWVLIGVGVVLCAIVKLRRKTRT